MRSVIRKNRIENTPDIFQHHRARPDFIHQTDGLWKQVALIGLAKLFSGH